MIIHGRFWSFCYYIRACEILINLIFIDSSMSPERKPAPQVFVSPELFDLLKHLESDHKFAKWVNEMKDALLFNMLSGDSIQKRRIPKYYRERYGVNNLFRYEHPEGYRSCYTLVNIEGVGVCPIILDLLSHPEYDRIFGYK